MRGSFKQIAAFMDPVNPPTSLAKLIAMHQRVDERRSFREIWRRHNHARRRESVLLFLNTFLMDVDPDFGLATKPAVGARAREIGQFLRANIDIAALAEVWKERTKDRILAQWPKDQRPAYADKITKTILNSGGLLTLSQTMAIVERKTCEFWFQSGIDAQADKGVLLVVIDVGAGPSRLEIYSTHLNAGDHARQTRYGQLIELAEFVTTTHHPANPAIIVGDFNIGAHEAEPVDPRRLVHDLTRMLTDPLSCGYPLAPPGRLLDALSRPYVETLVRQPLTLTDYHVLRVLMGALGFRDLWTWRNGTPGYTSLMDLPAVPGLICRPDRNPNYCDDFSVPEPPFSVHARGRERSPDRLDYMFVNEPAVAHSFTLDFTRPRRRRLERAPDAPERNKIAFLSDHLGLETTLLIAPK